MLLEKLETIDPEIINTIINGIQRCPKCGIEAIYMDSHYLAFHSDISSVAFANNDLYREIEEARR